MTCERNWSTFEFIHIKRRNRLEIQPKDRFKIQDSKRGVSLEKNLIPLYLRTGKLEWTDDIEERCGPEALGAQSSERASGGSSSTITYTQCNTSSTQNPVKGKDVDNIPIDDEVVGDDYGVPSEVNTRGDGDGDDFEMDDYDAWLCLFS